jgi:hypothetical protein
MKRYLKELAFGLVVYVLVQVAELLVTLPGWGGTGAYLADPAARVGALLIEFGLTAPVALLIAFLVAQFLRTPTVAAGLWRGLIWTAVSVVLYLVVAVGNDNLLLFGVPTFYLLAAAVLSGPVLAGWWAGRRR